MADPIQIQQVLLNLITNASQAMQMQEEHVKMIDVSENVENDIVTVSVRDYGTGIDEHVRNRLFEPFLTTKSEGTGIGLSISKYIIEDHQGIIQARNMSDTGAEFSFSLKVTDES
jgi:C4-dicarboxylate-specific signal transduction histidine kinase